MKTRKFTAMLLALAMVLSLCSVSVLAATHGDVTVEIPSGENLSLSTPSKDGNTYTFSVVSSIEGYNPFNFSLRVAPDAGVTVTVTGKNGASVTQEGTTSDDYWLVTPSATAASYVEIVSSGGYTYIINCAVPSGGTTEAGSGVYAYIPAPGQFTNEGVGSGGWGDIHNSGSTALKNMFGNVSSTGVSLGFFGGSVIFDFGITDGIGNLQDDPSNPYGVDFIVYGNAFSNNSEPGCVQVSLDGETWYDIAGSLHYNSDTIWDASLTYTNPTPSDNAAGAASSTLADVPYTGTLSGTITKNTFHNHSWYPLDRNYSADGLNLLPASLGSYTYDTATGESSLTLKGVILGSATNTQTANYTFGYADVHPNGSNYGVASNPYAAAASTSGGDGMDLAWAVYSSGEHVGEPVSQAILNQGFRYVRVYTGAAQMNGIFGEISTEVCGIYEATGTGTGAVTSVTNAALSITGVASPALASTITTANTYEVTPDEDITVSFGDVSGANVFVNGVSGTGSASLTVTLEEDAEQIIRVIVKDDTTGLPYIGYCKLVGAR